MFVKGCNTIVLVTKDPMQNSKILAYLLVGYFWLVGGYYFDNKGFLSHR